MIDLVCLLADKSMEATFDSILRRPEALGIRDIAFENVVHPRRDPGCFHEAGALLAGFVTRAQHALVVLDRDWAGAPADTGVELERLLEESLQVVGPPDWVRAIVIEPELESWVFSSSSHVAKALGWTGSLAELRRALGDQGLWDDGDAKPRDPKAAMTWALRSARLPPSSAIFRSLARTVSIKGCEDRSFLRLQELLRGWFGATHLGE